MSDHDRLEVECVGERAVLHVLLDRVPVGRADVALELGGNDRLEAERGHTVDLRRQRVSGRQGMRGTVLVERIGLHDRVAGPMREQPERRQVGRQVHVEEAGAHVDDRRVDDLALHVEHVDGIGDVHPAERHTRHEPGRRHPLAAQVSVGVGRADLDGVDLVGSDLLADRRQLLGARRRSPRWACRHCHPPFRAMFRRTPVYRSNCGTINRATGPTRSDPRHRPVAADRAPRSPSTGAAPRPCGGAARGARDRAAPPARHSIPRCCS